MCKCVHVCVCVCLCVCVIQECVLARVYLFGKVSSCACAVCLHVCAPLCVHVHLRVCFAGEWVFKDFEECFKESELMVLLSVSLTACTFARHTDRQTDRH